MYQNICNTRKKSYTNYVLDRERQRTRGNKHKIYFLIYAKMEKAIIHLTNLGYDISDFSQEYLENLEMSLLRQRQMTPTPSLRVQTISL